MNYKEELFWILDKEGERGWNAERRQENIDFVHSLGLKCDCVGWCSLDLGSPRADEILEKIELFCRENGWKARGWYTRTCIESESEWYELLAPYGNSGIDLGWTQAIGDDGRKMSIANIKAYGRNVTAPMSGAGEIMVPDRFRQACIREGFSEVDFCWVRDKGKYKAEQYFCIYSDQTMPRIVWGVDLSYEEEQRQPLNHHYPKEEIYKRFLQLRGYLPKLAEIFYDLHVQIPDCYLASDMPSGGIASVFYPSSFDHVGRVVMLIHKDAAEILLREKVLSPKGLRPVPVFDHIPAGYIVDRLQRKPRLPKEQIEVLQRQYEILMASNRPIRKISEKEALKSMRRVKCDQKEYFKKAMSKKQSESLMETEYAPLIPYYLVANGGCLSDEYELLSYETALEATKEFAASMEKEELLGEKPEGLVFTNCANGDVVLLCTGGTVVRFGHEEPEVLEQWPSVAQFVFDAITEEG